MVSLINYNFPQEVMDSHWKVALSMTIQGLHWGKRERGRGRRERGRERERRRERDRKDSCEGEAESLLTWRVNAFWGPGMGSFSAGAGTDKHTVSFSVVREAGDCKSRNIPEPLPSTVGQCQVQVSHLGVRQACSPGISTHSTRTTVQMNTPVIPFYR